MYPDRRVRYAALSAIMALNPPSAFPGASRVPETLGFFATSASGRRAVVAMPIADQATTLAGQLTKLGIDAQPATRGAAAVRLATQSADLDVVLVDVDIDAPGVRDVVFSLRSSPATGQVPIGLLATSERMEAAKQIAAEHENVIAFVRPQNDEGVTRIIEQLSQLSAREQISPQDRAAMGAQALNLARRAARSQPNFLRSPAPVAGDRSCPLPAGFGPAGDWGASIVGHPGRPASLARLRQPFERSPRLAATSGRRLPEECCPLRHLAHRRRNPPPIRSLQRQRHRRRRHAKGAWHDIGYT